MAKSKNKSSGTPRRKRYNRHARLQNAKKWVEQYNGENIAKGYSNWFGVDLLCAINELEQLGYKFKQSYKEKVNQSLITRQKQKETRKRGIEQEYDDDGNFYFIEGYTPNGVPYGMTKEQMKDVKEVLPRQLKSQGNLVSFIDFEDLPF